ncbi:MAG: hypothetical protein II920_03795 [Clostridia bacterium]|nr:hypothetical protein [Clostridia bacterium]
MREKLLVSTNWKFFFGEPEALPIRRECSDQTYRMSRAASAKGPARRDFDDSLWETVSVPHDFVAFNGISETDPHGGEHYDFPMDRGSAWYRRYFTLSKADEGKRITLYFEGVGTRCEVYLNAMLLKTNYTNGIGFEVDITDAVTFGGAQNVLAVHCDCHDFEAWYYEGGGITRNVYLIKTDRLSVAQWGTFVRTERSEGKSWRANIETELVNAYTEAKGARVLSAVYHGDKQLTDWISSEEVTIEACASSVVRQALTVPDVTPWCPETPEMYRLETRIEAGGDIVDEYSTDFGFREISFDADRGMLLNGKPVKIYGFANHMTYLGVGEAMSNSMCEYQIRTLSEMGSNGYRTAHSPHPEAIMDWCDHYGQLVMDENRCFRPSDICIDEVRRMVKRDRNHPSVCMWALYNEEDFVTCDTGKRIFAHLKQIVKQLDPTRPVTGATSYGMFSEGAHEDYDIFGFNHQTMHFDQLHQLKPDKPIFCSEMIFPLGCGPHMGDMVIRPGEDALQLKKPYVIGGFHFTAWNYGPERPRIIGMDGTPGTGYYGFKAYLKQHEPLCRICPGWDFDLPRGGEAQINIANNGDCTDLFINGRFIKRVETDMLSITPASLPYEEGILRAVTYKDGKIWAQDEAVTPGAPARLRLVCENRSLAADGADTAIVSAYITDAEGRVCTRETGRLLRFECDKNGELLTTLTLRPDLYQGRCGHEIRAFDGKAQAIFRSLETVGSLRVSVHADGLEPASIEINRGAGAFRQLPKAECAYIRNWRISNTLPAGTQDEDVIRAHMTERWLPVGTTGTPLVVNRHGEAQGQPLCYAYYAKSVIPRLDKSAGGLLSLFFEGIDGKADVYISGQKGRVHKSHLSDSPWLGHYRPEMAVPCDAFDAGDEVEIWVFMHDVGRVHGIGWPVYWMYTTREEIARLEEKTQREWNYCKSGK